MRGEPTPEQLAAVVAVVTARASGSAGVDEEPPARSLWARPQLRPALMPGPGAWTASALPR